MKNLLSFAIASMAITFLITGCSNKSDTTSNNASHPTEAVSPTPTATPTGTASPTVEVAGKSDCAGLKLPGKILITNQTFPFDHEPFKGSCFATFGNKDDMLDDKDVPRGSTFHIFTNGKDVFEFPDAFGGMSACWVDGVGFDDLNGDGLIDVVMAGRCLAAKDSYPSNAVFVNVGRGFTTSEEANAELDDLKNVGQIKAFAKKNIDRFFD